MRIVRQLARSLKQMFCAHEWRIRDNDMVEYECRKCRKIQGSYEVVARRL